MDTHHRPPHAAAHHHAAHALVAADRLGQAFAWGIALNLAFVGVEVVCGIAADSLSLLADAGHNFGDVMGLCLAWAATQMARRQPTPRFTYGWGSATILASLANAILLLVAVGGIAWEACGRLRSPPPVAGHLVIWAGLAGIVVNTVTALAFRRGHREDLNVRSAYLHLASDALVSLGVVLAALAMMGTGWLWLDPLVSLLVAAAILVGTWRLLRETMRLALQAVPSSIDPVAVRHHLLGLPGAVGVHDLHIWGISTTRTALTAHLVMPGGHPGDAFVESAVHGIRDRFGITHSTLQIEAVGCDSGCGEP